MFQLNRTHLSISVGLTIELSCFQNLQLELFLDYEISDLIYHENEVLLGPYSLPDDIGLPETIQTNEPVRDINYLFDMTDNPGLGIPRIGGSSTNKVSASGYLSFRISDKTTMKLPITTENVPCYVSFHFRVAVVKSSHVSPLKEMTLCSMLISDNSSATSICYWMATCGCLESSTSCLVRVSFYSGGLQVVGEGWRVLGIGPGWAE